MGTAPLPGWDTGPVSALRTTRAPDIGDVQARTLRVLMTSQVLGGVGVASGIAVGALLAADISGRDDLSGLANTTQVLGAALLTVPVAALMAARGRRVGLVAAYAVGTVGAVLAVLAAVLGSFLLLLLGTALFGAATTATAQARYAAVDLAEPHRRSRQLSLLVWATTVGSVLGPNLIGPGAAVARGLGLPELVGAWLFSAAGFVAAAALVHLLLRPDPLLTARALAATPVAPHVAGPAPAGPAPTRSRGTVRRGLRVIAATPTALLGTVAITGGHAVMVAVMVMTPLHMSHGHAEIEVIGLVISVHILGMYGLSPLTGWLADRYGATTVVAGGAATQVLACLLAMVTHEGYSHALLLALFLLGLGWSGTMVAGSTLVAQSVSVADRSAVQGSADLVMGLVAALAGALAGVVVQQLGYGVLAGAGAGLALALAAFALARRRVVSLSG